MSGDLVGALPVGSRLMPIPMFRIGPRKIVTTGRKCGGSGVAVVVADAGPGGTALVEGYAEPGEVTVSLSDARNLQVRIIDIDAGTGRFRVWFRKASILSRRIAGDSQRLSRLSGRTYTLDLRPGRAVISNCRRRRGRTGL